MKIDNDLWYKSLILYKEYNNRNEILSVNKLKKILGISDPLSRQILFALQNKDVIKNQPSEFEPDNKVLVMADLHIPYHDKSAVDTMMRFADKYQPDIIVILGDLLDFYQISVFSKNPKNPRVEDEIRIGKEFLTKLRHKFPKARIIYKTGNHDGERLQRYIFEKASDLSGLLQGLLPDNLELGKLGIEYLTKPFKIGKLWYLHGHEASRGGNPEYITNVVFKKVLDNVIFGHFHRQQEKVFKRIDNTFYWAGAVGCLCQNLEYAGVNNWTHGFATVTYDKQGNFRANLKQIIDGEIY